MDENRLFSICRTCLGYLLDHPSLRNHKKCNICGNTMHKGVCMVNWDDPKAKLSKYFTVGEATFLPKLGIYYKPNDIEKGNILRLAEKMDVFRELVGKPILVNIWIRPTVIKDDGSSVDYNALVGGAKNSAHKKGSAVDFQVSGLKAQEVRDLMKDKLQDLGLRMEDGVSWCHCDDNPVPPGGKRIFKP